jgi:hypothetical protein
VVETLNLVEVLISSDQLKAVLDGGGGDPQIVVRDRTPLLPQHILEAAVRLGCDRIT